MAERGKGDNIITIIVAIALLAAAILVIYTSLDNDDTKDYETLLTVIYQENQWNYTMSDLENLDRYSGEGSMMKSSGTISGPYEFGGVPITTLLENANITDFTSFELNVTSADGWFSIFNDNAITGNVSVFDETGNETTWSKPIILLLAYTEDNKEISEEDGPLRIVYIGEENPITSSEYWVKKVVSIEIV